MHRTRENSRVRASTERRRAKLRRNLAAFFLLAAGLSGCQSDGTNSPDPANDPVEPDVVTEDAGTSTTGPDFAAGATTTSVVPWRDETFSKYSSDSHWRSDPFDWMITPSPWFNQYAIHIDRSVTYDGHPTLRYDWPGATASSPLCNSMMTREAGYRLPAVTEMWIEVVHKFSTSWNTNHYTNPYGRCGVAQYKFLLMWRAGLNDRFGLSNGTNGRQWNSTHPSSSNQPTPQCSGIGFNCILGYGTGQEQYRSVIPGPQWDSNWHVYRAHIKMPNTKGEKTGVFELWIDGVLVKRVTGQDFIRDGKFSNRLAFLGLGSNSNSATSRPTSNWWGRIRVWTKNPGW